MTVATSVENFADFTTSGGGVATQNATQAVTVENFADWMLGAPIPVLNATQQVNPRDFATYTTGTGPIAPQGADRFVSVENFTDFTLGAPINRAAVQHPMESIGIAGSGSNIVTYYKKRARDSACGTVTYVTWVTTNVNQAYPFAFPCGGPLVEEIIAETWQVQS